MRFKVQRMKVLDSDISLKTTLVWGAILLSAAIGATYTVTKASVDANVDALETILEAKDENILKLQNSVVDYIPVVSFSPKTLNQISTSPEIKALAERVFDLEKERGIILKELSERSTDSLSPESELAGLMSQLSSGNRANRIEALRGLFTLKDVRSIPTLITIYFSNPEGIADIYNIVEWLRLVWELDQKSGAEFSARLLESADESDSKYAYGYLRDEPTGSEVLDAAREPLEVIALTSKSSLARTRAKMLLSHYERLQEKSEPKSRGRSLFDVLIDIERDVKTLLPKENEE